MGEGEPQAKITANRAGLPDERRYELVVQRADKRLQMGEPREPEPPDRSMFASYRGAL